MIEFSTITTGTCLILAGACLGVKQMLSAPDRPNYPETDPYGRFIMFWLSALVIAWGVNIIAVGDSVSGYAAVATPFLFVHFAHRLYAHLTKRATVRTHRLIRRLHAMARCAPREGVVAARASAMANSTGGVPAPVSRVPEALLTLSLDGARVAGPNEGPEAFTGPWQ